MLECHDLRVSYRQVRALHGVSLRVGDGELVSVMGPNGAGKTTLLRAIAGLEPCAAGRVVLEGTDVTNVRPSAIVRRGVSLVPPGRQLFVSLSVDANLALGGYTRPRDAAGRRELAEDRAYVDELFPVLRERASQAAGTLSGGEQQMLAIGRALLARPRLLLLDEPSLGLAPRVLESIMSALVRLNDERGVSIVLVEQNARLALEFAARTYVLDTGHVVDEGDADQLGAYGDLAASYFGETTSRG